MTLHWIQVWHIYHSDLLNDELYSKPSINAAELNIYIDKWANIPIFTLNLDLKVVWKMSKDG